MKPTLSPALFLFLAATARVEAAANPYNLPDGLYAEITATTSNGQTRGVVVGELYYKKTPLTVVNYVGLAEGTLGTNKGKPYYEGLKWFRVEPGFVIQGGDGGRTGLAPFPDEIVPGLRHDSMGVIQMANSGPDSNGSQWCMMLSPQQRLNYEHTVFGHVVRGLDVLPNIQRNDVMHVKILRLGAEAKAFKADQAAFDKLVAAAKRYNGPRQPGPNTPFDDPDKILPAQYARAQHFNFKLVNYNRFTGQHLAARLLAKAPDGDLNDYMRQMATNLNTASEGAFVVYLADKNEWHLWIGEDSVSKFLGKPAPTDSAELTQALHQAKEEFLSAALKTAEPIIAKAEATPNPANPMGPAQRIKLQVDAVLDNLIFRLEPKSK